MPYADFALFEFVFRLCLRTDDFVPIILLDLAIRDMKQTRLPDFRTKLVYVRLIGEGYNLAVDRPKWQVQGGRLFLVGTVPPAGSTRDWSLGETTGIAWDQVSDYIIFDSVEHYNERMAIFERKKRNV